MEIITKCVQETIRLLPTELSWTESNYQRCLSYLLSQFGVCENEVVLSYNVIIGGRKVCVGAGRCDIIFVPHGTNRTWILELKIAPKAYNMKYYHPQIMRYCKMYKQDYGPCEGVVVVFSNFKTACEHVVNSNSI